MTQQINLYDPQLRRQRELLTATNLALTSMILLLIVMVAGAWVRTGAGKLEAEAALLAPQAKALQNQIPVLGRQLSTRKPDARLEQQLAGMKAQESIRVAILALLQKGLGPGAVSFAEYLRGFARQTPSGLWLTGFAVAGDGTGMEIRGRTTNPALIPEYIRRLNAEKAFQGRAFAALQLSVPAPATGNNAAAVAGTVPATNLPLAPSYHEFTLTPVLGDGAAETSDANRSPMTAGAQP
ncbi:MSHA biogenesis protein MshI [Georgfuchsia toluolica]|uniref:MSHA biogenesis protein MshI n=1 Tax=Georgfuchsia toluolica TaxID=424218 RepID=A0A916JA79_9PROT|nr:PilN domain-containing protein [Georgfuchsia toluolica]CAG4885203.1 MSHA biogenesis protein MshI [Georgfuchsia toluolica]